jgi:hypothetical protein
VDLFLETAGTLLAIMHLDDFTKLADLQRDLPPQQEMANEKKWYTHPSIFPFFGLYCYVAQTCGARKCCEHQTNISVSNVSNKSKPQNKGFFHSGTLRFVFLGGFLGFPCLGHHF